MTARVRISALVLACGLGAVVACSAAQTKSEAQNAAILAGCTEALAIARDAGEAGATDQIERGCEASLRAWRTAK